VAANDIGVKGREIGQGWLGQWRKGGVRLVESVEERSSRDHGVIRVDYCLGLVEAGLGPNYIGGKRGEIGLGWWGEGEGRGGGGCFLPVSISKNIIKVQ